MADISPLSPVDVPRPSLPTGVAETQAAFVGYVREGLPIRVVDQVLADGRLTISELDRLAIPRKTLAHRRTIGTLTPEQSDRLSRLLRVIEDAEITFGDRKKAHDWLRRPTPLLDNESPLDRLDTDIGTRQVEMLLGRIAHGIAA
jgi:putative toxin-antitoxin system antitoxin component (TIGR02293 family)